MRRARLQGPVRAVTFDLDFTLWDLTGVLEHAESCADVWLRGHFPTVGERYDASALKEVRLELADRHAELRHDVTALRKAAFRYAGEQCDVDGDDLDALVRGAFEAFLAGRHDVVIYDDAVPLLEWLHGRVRIGAITNGNAELARLSLGRYFDFSVSAIEVGAAKPSRLVFETACRRAGVPPETIVHVGDDCESDVLGAAGFGMQAVRVDRDDGAWPEHVERLPHVHVRSLADLKSLLEPHITAGTSGSLNE